MYPTVCSLAHMYQKANYTCTIIVHHVTGEFFLTFETFFKEAQTIFEVLAIYNNEKTQDIMLPT